MLEQVLQWDQDLFVLLNNLGSKPYDFFWITITTIKNWIPIFLLFFVCIAIKFPKKEVFLIICTTVALIFFMITFTDLVKHIVQRLRPNNCLEIKDSIRILKNPSSYSFFSGHASSSFSISTLLFLFLRKRFAFAFLFFCWPILFAYSRIYVGVHYPLDILVGAIVGALSALMFFFFYVKVIAPYLRLNRP